MYIFCNKPSVYVGDQNAACHTSPVNRASVRKCNVNHEITATLSCIYIWQATIGVLSLRSVALGGPGRGKMGTCICLFFCTGKWDSKH